MVFQRAQHRAFHCLCPPRTDLVLEMIEMPRLRGRLVDDAGAPLGRWMVRAEPVSDPTAVRSIGSTCDDGTFEIPDLEDTDYRLCVDSQGQAARRAVLPRPARGGADLGDVVATLEGRIRGGSSMPRVSPFRKRRCRSTGSPQERSRRSRRAGRVLRATGLDPAAQYFVGVVGTSGRPSWEGRIVPTEGVRPGTNDVRLVRE